MEILNIFQVAEACLEKKKKLVFETWLSDISKHGLHKTMRK